jgi:hypothetical protein
MGTGSLCEIDWPLYFPAIGGLVAVIGILILICSEDARIPRSYTAGAVLMMMLMIVNAFEMVMTFHVYIFLARDEHHLNDEAGEVAVGVGHWLAKILGLVIVVSLCCFIIDLRLALDCVQHRTAVINKTEAAMLSARIDDCIRRCKMRQLSLNQNPGAPPATLADPIAAPAINAGDATAIIDDCIRRYKVLQLSLIQNPGAPPVTMVDPIAAPANNAGEAIAIAIPIAEAQPVQ